MKRIKLLVVLIAFVCLWLPQIGLAASFVWANANITATPTATLDWLTGGPNTQASWTGGTPVSNNGNTIQFFQDASTALLNTGASGNTQTANLNNGGPAFQLGVLSLSGKASATAGANLAMSLSGDPLNFSAATATISLDGVNNTRTLTYNLSCNIQLGTASSAGALTIQGVGTGAFNIGGVISELQTGGGSLTKLGSSAANLTAGNTFTGATTVSAGTLTLSGASGSINNSSDITLNGGKLALDNSGNNNANRIANNVSLSSGGELSLTGNASADTAEAFGTLGIGLASSIVTVSQTNSGRVATLAASSFSRTANGTALVRGTSLGQLSTVVGKISFTSTTGLNFVGSGQPAGTGTTKTLSIVPYLIGDTSATGSGSGMVTYDTSLGSLRPLVSGEYTTLAAVYATPTTHENVKAFNGTITAASPSLNSLLFGTSSQTLNGSGTLTVDSGAIIAINNPVAIGSGFSGVTLGNGTWNEGMATVISTHVLTINTPISVTGSGGLTKSGSGTLILTANPTYGGTTTVNAGTLVADASLPGSITLNGGTLQLGNSDTLGTVGGTVTVTSGGTLSYKRTDVATPITGVITGAGGTLSAFSGTFTLGSANFPASSINTFAGLGGASGATIVLNGDPTSTIYLTNAPAVAGQTLDVKSGAVSLVVGRHVKDNILVEGGSLTVLTDRYSPDAGGSQSLTISGGTFTVASTASAGARLGCDTGGPGLGSTAFAGTQSGGTFNVFKGGSSTSFGLGGTTGSLIDTYALSGGTLNIYGAGTDGYLVLGADTGGTSTTAFTLSGTGKLIVTSTIQGSQGSGAVQNFVFNGGTLAARTVDMTRLTTTGATTGTAATLNNNGGALAPGDVGAPGKTSITGNYAQSAGSLAIDIGGTSPATAFTNLGSFYDVLAVSGTAALGGNLNVNLTNGYVPDATGSFTILTSGGALSGAFANVTAGRVPVANYAGGSFQVVVTATSVTLTNFQMPSSAVSTTTAVQASPNPSAYGGSATLTATVQTNGYTAGNATSNCVFKVDGNPVATNGMVNGVATYITSSLTAGSHSITAEYSGDINYTASTNSPALSQTVNKATPSLTAPTAGAILYGQTLASSGLSGGAATNASNQANVAGNFAFADTTIAPQVGTTNVTVNFTPGDAANYNSASIMVTVTVNPATVTLLLTSSSQTNGYHSSLSFTVTNLPGAAGSNVVFAANGVPFSTNNVVNGGTTSLSITNLPRGGTNSILATYNGDGTYLPASTNLIQTVTNHPPVAAVMTVTRTAGLALIIALSDVATNWTDNPDGDPVSLAGVTMQSTNGVNLFALNWSTNLDGSIVTTNAYAFIGYTNSPNRDDQISYSISDGFGGTNIGYVNIVIQSSVTGTNSITGHDFTSPYSNTITAYGIPNFYYVLERATNLTSPVWVEVQTNQANATNGIIKAADTFWDMGGVKPNPSAFYQLKWQP